MLEVNLSPRRIMVDSLFEIGVDRERNPNHLLFVSMTSCEEGVGANFLPVFALHYGDFIAKLPYKGYTSKELGKAVTTIRAESDNIQLSSVRFYDDYIALGYQEIAEDGDFSSAVQVFCLPYRDLSGCDFDIFIELYASDSICPYETYEANLSPDGSGFDIKITLGETSEGREPSYSGRFSYEAATDQISLAPPLPDNL